MSSDEPRALHSGLSSRDRARKLIFGNFNVPYDKWLCANNSNFGKNSLRYYFSNMHHDAVWETVKSMGKGKITCASGVSMYRANASQRYGTNNNWVLFGAKAPKHDVIDDIRESIVQDGTASGSRSVTQQPVAADARKQPAAPSTDCCSPAAHLSHDDDVPSYMERVDGEPKVDNTDCCLWSLGQLSALVQLLNDLPKGAVANTTFQHVGVCVRAALILKGGRKHTVSSAEFVGRQMHPNLRYAVAAVTAPGFTPTSAQRTMMALGVTHIPAERNIMRSRKNVVMPMIHSLAQKSLKRAREQVCEAAKADGAIIEVNGFEAAAETFNSDGFGAKRSYNNWHTGEGVGVALMARRKVVDYEYTQNNDRCGGFANHAGSVATGESAALRELGERQLDHSSGVPLHIARIAAAMKPCVNRESATASEEEHSRSLLLSMSPLSPTPTNVRAATPPPPPSSPLSLLPVSLLSPPWLVVLLLKRCPNHCTR